jgi:hypothetical protein
MKMFDNVILTDADGVLVYWEHTFINWMYFNGYGKPDSSKYELHEKYGITENESRLLSKMFNESTMLSKLPPMRDAIKYVKKLHEEHGFVFHCISAVPDLDSTRKARWENLENLFGKTAFERIVLCEYSHKKDEFLKQYEGSECYWIEDLPKNAELGLKYGLNCLLVDQEYNENYVGPVKKVKNWKEIYNIITGEV